LVEADAGRPEKRLRVRGKQWRGARTGEIELVYLQHAKSRVGGKEMRVLVEIGVSNTANISQIFGKSTTEIGHEK
jgi:hypothetical protein